MNLESLFFGKQESLKNEGGKGEKEESVVSRRTFLKALGGLAVAATIEPDSALADGIEHLREIAPQQKKENIKKIESYLDILKSQTDVFEHGSKNAMLAVLKPRALYSREMLEGTLFDQEGWFRDMTSGSWPSVQVWQENGGEIPELRFAHEKNQPDEQDAQKGHYANSFFVNGVFVSNKHAAYNSKKKFPKCQIINDDTDIAACPMAELSNDEANWSDVERVNLTFEASSRSKDIQGTLVHIPSIHESRKLEGRKDDVSITSGVLIKITPNMLKTKGNKNGFIECLNGSQNYEAELLRSYMAIIPSMDANGDGKKNDADVWGISGSPVFLQSDCRKEIRTPSGIVWGAGTIQVPSEAQKYTVVFVHGPDVLGEMLEQVGSLE